MAVRRGTVASVLVERSLAPGILIVSLLLQSVACSDPGVGEAGRGGHGGSGGIGGAGGGGVSGSSGAGAGTSGTMAPCPSGMHVVGSQCVADPGECPAGCLEHGICEGDTCTCDEGYAGSACDACADGYVADAVSGLCIASACAPNACPGQSCNPLTGACCASGCELGQVECAAGELRTCESRASGCPEWSAFRSCAAGDCLCPTGDPGVTIRQWGGVTLITASSVRIAPDGAVLIGGASNGAFAGQPLVAASDQFLLRTYLDGSDDDWYVQWGTDGSDGVEALEVLADGTILAAGYFGGDYETQPSAGGRDIAVTQWGADKARGWFRQFGTNQLDTAHAILADATGSLYLAGETSGALAGVALGEEDGFVSKLAGSNGGIDWTVRLGSAGRDFALDLGIDTSGALLVAGSHDEDIACWKRDAAGDEVWTAVWGTTSRDIAAGIAVASDDSIVLVGVTGGDLGGQGSGSAFITRLDDEGELLWTYQLGENASAYARAVAFGPEGDVYVVGDVSVALVEGAYAGGTTDAFVQRRQLDGTVVWTRHLGTGALDRAYDVAVGADGTVYVVGVTRGAFPGFAQGSTTDGFLAIISQ